MTVLELLYGSVQSVTRAQCSSSSVSKQQLQGVALSTSSIAVLARGQLLMVSIQVCLKEDLSMLLLLRFHLMQ
jgi:hypothetical protein